MCKQGSMSQALSTQTTDTGSASILAIGDTNYEKFWLLLSRSVGKIEIYKFV